ncbi:MAG: hypothetical protein AAGA45_02980 [Verrucomicrobiota bacterium]
MSLINEALKKAQRDREQGQAEKPAEGSTAENAPAAAPAPVTAAPRAGNPASAPSFKIMTWIVSAALLVGGTTAAVIFMFKLVDREQPEPVTAEARPGEVAVRLIPREEAPAVTVNPAPSQSAAITPEAKPSGESSPEPIAFTLPPEQTTQSEASNEPAPSPEPATATEPAPVVATEPEPVPVVATVPVVQPTAPPPAPEALPEPAQAAAPEAEPIAFSLPEQPVSVGQETPVAVEDTPLPESRTDRPADPNVIAFLEKSRINGIRVEGKFSRVLMNNQVFKEGSLVDPRTQLRIKTIQPTEITFIDESGLEYRKQFQR